jgi:hypothetical protein
VGWLANNSPHGWAQYLRPFSISQGWLASAIRVSGDDYGRPSVWPGDTFGISTVSPGRLVVSWGGAVRSPRSAIHAVAVRFGSG